MKNEDEKGEMMTTAKTGDAVKVHYTGTLEDGTLFDSSEKRGEPIEFTIGEGQLLGKFEEAVVGMEPGEEKAVKIEAGEGYGPRRDELVGKIPNTQLPEDLSPEVGMQLQVQTPEGQPMVITVVGVGDDHIVVDGNHILAGQDLNFDIKLMEIQQ
jgi:FKBP-type peptidyl-prolyl cis-trans isomerase 2